MLIGLFRLGRVPLGHGYASLLAFWTGGGSGGIELPPDTGEGSDWIIRRRRRKLSSRRR